MYQKDVAKMAKYTSTGFVTYGTHSRRRAARAWIALCLVGRIQTAAAEGPSRKKLEPLPGSHAARCSHAVEGAMGSRETAAGQVDVWARSSRKGVRRD
jgi:hypothetical protein